MFIRDLSSTHNTTTESARLIHVYMYAITIVVKVYVLHAMYRALYEELKHFQNVTCNGEIDNFFLEKFPLGILLCLSRTLRDYNYTVPIPLQ